LPPTYGDLEEENPEPTEPALEPGEESLWQFIKRYTRAILEPLGPQEQTPESQPTPSEQVSPPL